MSAVAILLSGGVDSTALAFWKKPNLAFTIDYGQASAKGEIRAATQIAAELGIAHEIIEIDCAALGSGDLAGKPPLTSAPAPEWWPYRNQFLITVAAMKAMPLGVGTLLVGSVKSDFFHSDGRPEFYERMDHILSIQEGALRVEAPGLAFTAVELVRCSKIPDSILGWTHSCHKAEFACGACRGCWKRENVLDELGW